MTEDETVGWHRRLIGHEFESTPGVGDGQGGLVCCSPWGHRAGPDWQTKLTSPGLGDERIRAHKAFRHGGLHAHVGLSEEWGGLGLEIQP